MNAHSDDELAAPAPSTVRPPSMSPGESAAKAAGLADPYDALLLVSFGGPEGSDEVMPYLERVTAGRVPRARLVEVAAHYDARGGVSPINAETRALRAALGHELAGRGVDLPVVWANRHSAPEMADVLRECAAAGMKRLLAVLTSAFPSYSGCRVYREELAAALAQAGVEQELCLDLIPPFGLTPGFLDTMTRLTTEAVLELATEAGADAAQALAEVTILFVTHSVPEPMSRTSGSPTKPGAYLAAHLAACEAVAAGVAQRVAGAARDHARSGGRVAQGPVAGDAPWELVYCSRSGRPTDPWLEPDVNDALEAAAARGVRRIALVPIGFVSDHMEVVYDLDEEAAETAASLGISLRRVPTVRDDAEFVAGLVDLVLQRAARECGETPDGAAATAAVHPAFGGGPVLASACPPGCCPSGRAVLPTIGEELS